MGAALAAGTTFARLMLAFIVPIVIAIFALLFFIKRETKGVLIEELADSKNLYQRSIR
jgi:septation ring formation regulator EzrA